MQSSVWGAVPAAASGASDPAALLNSQLANALSTMGDAHFWEESISPSTIRTSLASSDPSNPNSTPTLLRGMKWLLASISKGRNVSDFYPHVVKLVGASSLEVRKMVYMFLVQYADHDATTRELSLLSINSFQRGLADPEQLIRALALRVLTSIRVADIVQIQILGVQKCASDKSPYVRKCAANALAKLQEQCCSDHEQKQMLIDIMKKLLDTDNSTMVLTSAVIAFVELCPERLELLHRSYRRLCNQLVDMDEWGQVVIIDVLQRYCRQFFCAPREMGSAEAIDAERRVVRTLQGTKLAPSVQSVSSKTQASGTVSTLPALPPSHSSLRKIKRRVIKKGFYSDEEDESTEEEVYPGSGPTPLQVAAAARQHANLPSLPNKGGLEKYRDLEDESLDEDHRLLLRSTLPLLKSRNSAVVLAVCSLHYYCGVASIRVRSSLGKALVRIHRDRREIQYVVLTSIRALVKECPSAFTPFLQDFYVKGMDPSFTRLIKLDILTMLALEPNSIEAVLLEIRTYVRNDDDKAFCCAAIRAVGKVAELARIVHDRHGQNTGNVEKERKQANNVALNALYGLFTLTRASSDPHVVGECCIVMQRILLQLSEDDQGPFVVEDPNHIQESSWKRLLLLLVRSLSTRSLDGIDESEDSQDDELRSDNDMTTFRKHPQATAACLWIVGDWLSSSINSLSIRGLDQQARQKTRLELVRLVSRAFLSMQPVEKLQSIHFASKLIITSKSPQESALCELILSMGRADILPDVRDRARMESNLINSSIGLQYDTDNIASSLTTQRMSVEQVKKVLLSSKVPSSSLPLENEKDVAFRFGTLSSLVNHRAKTAYLPLPKWAKANSPSSLRDEEKSSVSAVTNEHSKRSISGKVDAFNKSTSGFYDSDGNNGDDDENEDEDSEFDDSDEDGQGDESDWASDDSENGTSDSDDSDGSDFKDSMPRGAVSATPLSQIEGNVLNQGPVWKAEPPSRSRIHATALVDQDDINDDDGSNSDESSWEEDEDEDSDDTEPAVATSNLLGMSQKIGGPVNSADLLGIPSKDLTERPSSMQSKSNGSYAQGLEGLVMAPIVLETEVKVDPNIDRDSSAWIELVRPELAGGLSMRARYLRGPTREHQARLVGLDPNNPAVILLQVQFQNMRTDVGVLRRVRIINRSSTSGYIGLKRAALPPEILALGKAQLTCVILGLEFASLSDKEGSLQARFDVKSDRGSNALDLRPPLVELVLPIVFNPSIFDDTMNRLVGFQRVVSSFVVSVSQIEQLDSVLLKHVALRPLDAADSWIVARRLRLVGQLPASVDKVFVLLDCAENGSGRLIVCCDNAIAANSVIDSLRKALK